MTVLNVIKKAVKILGDENLLAYLDGGEVDSDYQEDKDLLLMAYNQSLRSVSMYFPLTYTESFSPIDNLVKYERFSFNPFKIKNVKAKSGGYEIFPTEISANSDITVEYYYFPKAEDYSEEYSFKGVCDETDIAYGILAEYLLYKGRYSEGSTYFDKFINALSSYSRAQKKSKLKSREWF
ncbi:MAG: hypothetical protein J6V66_05340 [Clostridia bacterium]|nr:hypothetical protein [Clostridia bacterium]